MIEAPAKILYHEGICKGRLMSNAAKNISYNEAKKIAQGKDVNARIDLASSEETPQELLFFLANDAEESVRMAVAHNFATPWDADQLLSQDKNPNIRSAVTDKVIEKIDRNDYHEKKSPLNKLWKKVTHVFDSLVDDSISFIRQKAARTVISKGYFPKDMVVKLVNHEDKEIAVYAIEHAADLTDDELLSLLNESSDVKIVAIARRRHLSGEVIDALVETDKEDAINTMLKNQRIHIPDPSMHKVIDKAETNADYQKNIVQRKDLNLGIIKKVSNIVSGTLLKDLMLQNKLSKKEAKEVMEEVKKRLDGDEILTIMQQVLNNEFYNLDSQSAEDMAYQDFLKGKLTEDHLKKALDCYQEDYVIAALSLRSNVSKELIDKALNQKNAKVLVALVWRAGFSMPFATEIQKKLGKMSSSIIYPRNEKSYPFTPKEMNWQIDFFSDLGGKEFIE